MQHCFAYLLLLMRVRMSFKRKKCFDRCLKVISTSENKLSISPEITEKSDLKRVAVFTLSDGKLTITCDGEKNLVTVSTSLD